MNTRQNEQSAIVLQMIFCPGDRQSRMVAEMNAGGIAVTFEIRKHVIPDFHTLTIALFPLINNARQHH